MDLKKLFISGDRAGGQARPAFATYRKTGELKRESVYLIVESELPVSQGITAGSKVIGSSLTAEILRP